MLRLGVLFVAVLLIGSFIPTHFILAQGPTVQFIQTSQRTLDRLTPQPSLTFSTNVTSNPNVITVDSSTQYQTIFGFGGAFTDAASINFASLNPELQQVVLDAYWGPEGIGYSIGRVHMNSCDFSLFSYNFDNFTGDSELTDFDTNVTHDQRTMIPFILRANQTAVQTGTPIWLFLTPWSPPGWMKVPVDGVQSMDGSATPNGLLQEYMASWALYFSKFIQAYENSGVHMWGLTPQNEPEYAAGYEACVYEASYESIFIANYLGPQMAADFPDIKIMGYDHNRDDIYTWAETLYSNETTKNFLSGIAFHWYVGNELYNVNKTYWLDPSKFLLATEGCNCPGVILGDWSRAENYGRDIIADMNFYAAGWVDWNLLLDPAGGPNHVQNYCDAHIIADIEHQAVYFQPSYYYFGQISKYVPRGSVRVSSTSSVNLNTLPTDLPQIASGDNVIIWDCNGAPNQRWAFNSNSQLVTLNTNQCAAVENSSEDDGTNVEVQACTNTKNQKWTYSALNAGGQIKTESGQCMAVQDDSLENGANVQILDCTQDLNRYWYVNTTDSTIRSESSGLCLTVGWSAFDHAAFVTPTGETVLVVMNASDAEMDFLIKDTSISGQVSTSILPHTIQTYIW